MNIKEFKEALKGLNIDLNEVEELQLEKYYEFLIKTNEHVNLTRITNKEEVYLKHFYDSLTLVKAYDFTKDIKVCDVGTGAGFPGVVLKIIFPNIHLTLVDALEKRVKFLTELLKILNINDVEIIHARIEEYASLNREKFDVVTCRAVAKLNVLTEICLPLVKVDGYFIPMKAELNEELDESLNVIKLLNAKIVDRLVFNLPKENAVRTLIKIQKIGKCSVKYPRKYAEIKKKPLS